MAEDLPTGFMVTRINLTHNLQSLAHSRSKSRCRIHHKRPPFPSFRVCSRLSQFTVDQSLTLIDIIPNPTLGSGSPALRISDLFSTHDFDSINREAIGQAQIPRSLKQAVEHVLQDMKPSQRTH